MPKAAGKMFVKSDGSIFYFCSSKCQNNWNLKRDPKKVGWIRKRQPGEEKGTAKPDTAAVKTAKKKTKKK